MRENLIVNLDVDTYQHDTNPNIIKFWHIFLVILVFLVGLFIATFVVCGTSSICKLQIPTLHNLMESTLITPFLITALNVIFLLHFLVSIGIYFLSKYRAKRWDIVLLIFTISTYGSIIITLFVFPFTDWDNDYANYLIIISLCLWMFAVNMCLINHYKHIIYRNKHFIIWNIVAAVIYFISSVLYFVLHTFFPLELSGILAVEICSGLSVVVFLAVCVFHLWKLEFVVKVSN